MSKAAECLIWNIWQIFIFLWKIFLKFIFQIFPTQQCIIWELWLTVARPFSRYCSTIDYLQHKLLGDKKKKKKTSSTGHRYVQPSTMRQFTTQWTIYFSTSMGLNLFFFFLSISWSLWHVIVERIFGICQVLCAINNRLAWSLYPLWN